MAQASFYDMFLRLPPSAAFLFLASILGTTDGHALPRQTNTIELHELNVVPFPLMPTEAPIAPHELLRRQENTVCGYIGGDLALPATCGVGSHCVLDLDNKAVGCCPNAEACSTGVFTGCVDGSKGPQTEVNPYIYTCQGSDVCYMNSFAGGYSQYGCGTASDLGTTVETSVDGITTSLELPKTSVELTQSPSSLSEPTTIGSGSRSFTTGSSSTASSTIGTISSSATTTSGSTSSSTSGSTSTSSATSSSATVAPTEAPPTDGSSGDSRTGAIVGGTLGAVAGLLVLAGLAFFLLRRRQNNPREGPGPAPAPLTSEYNSPMRSHGAAFAPLPSWQEDQGNFYGNPYDQHQNSDSSGYQPENQAGGNYNTVPIVPPPQRYEPVHVAGVGTGLAPVEEEETYHHHHHHHDEPAPREIDDFSRAYSDARIGQVTDDDTRPLTAPEDLAALSSNDTDNRSPIRGGNRPLWQQNRQRSRNLMWM